MQISLPELSLVVLVGASSSGKSTFVKKHFLNTEVISSDACRALVSDDENSLDATNDAFALLHYLAGIRLKRGKLTVIDATNVQAESRKSLLRLAKEYHCIPVVIALNLPEKTLIERHEQRSDRNFSHQVLYKQVRELRSSLRTFKREGFRHIFVLDSPEQIEQVQITRTPLWNNLKSETGPFDIIGDVHGCMAELLELLEKLGYQVKQNLQNADYQIINPEGRKLVFLGDLVDRGPNSPAVLRLVMDLVKNGQALCVPGNHDMKLLKKLNGKDVQLKHGLAETMQQLSAASPEFIQEIKGFLDSLVSHYVLDGGKLVVAHAGLREEMQGRGSAIVRNFCLYGETTGEIDEFGLPVRYPWASEYRGKAMMVYGHTPIPEPEWLNHTLNIDTGCVFGGHLTALRYPEKEIIKVKAQQVYCEPSRPLELPTYKTATAQQEQDDVLDIEDVIGKRLIHTHLRGNITIREEQSIVALEVMSRFAINPKWLIYLPPTMSPTETSDLPEYLEHPLEGLDYFRKQGIEKVICEEKHMGSRAVVIVCQSPEVAQTRFGLAEKSWGTVYTRTGRAFFKEIDLEQAFLQKINQALNQADFWAKMQTDWVCLDCELMPWSAKAQELIKSQYASVAASAKYALQDSLLVMEKAQNRGLDLAQILQDYQQKNVSIQKYTQAFRQYCRPTNGLEGLTLAPFHILATENQVHTNKTHLWQMETIADFCQFAPDFLMATPYKIIDLNQEADIQVVTDWWVSLTESGGEGMVIKPLDFVVKTNKDLVQPAVKCRGKEYLRIIYGSEYTSDKNLQRLKKRGLSQKRSLAIREFALGIESLQRFVQKEPLRRVHECVFGVLALESEEVDPRL
jgi:protein phosphatase